MINPMTAPTTGKNQPFFSKDVFVFVMISPSLTTQHFFSDEIISPALIPAKPFVRSNDG
jgi:hypothetical protein